MAILPYQGLYIGFPTVFNPIGAIPPPATNYTRINQVELASSRDLYHWERAANRTPFLGVEPWDGSNYGTSQLLMSGPPIVRESGEIWIYYNALRLPGSIEQYQRFNRGKELFRLGVDERHFADGGALSLAKLPPDRFVSVDGDEIGLRRLEIGVGSQRRQHRRRHQHHQRGQRFDLSAADTLDQCQRLQRLTQAHFVGEDAAELWPDGQTEAEGDGGDPVGRTECPSVEVIADPRPDGDGTAREGHTESGSGAEGGRRMTGGDDEG